LAGAGAGNARGGRATHVFETCAVRGPEPSTAQPSAAEPPTSDATLPDYQRLGSEAEPGWYKEPAADLPETATASERLSVLAKTYTSWRAIEALNGRVAMLGIFGDFAVELQTGMPAVQQETVRWPFVSLTIAAVLLGSLAPALRGYEGSDGLAEAPDDYYFFTAEAERLLGRAAMMGFALTVIIEQLDGGLSVLRPLQL